MRLRFLVALGVVAPSAAAQTTVSGVVRDSLAHVPLAGAIVQLVTVSDAASSARTATADAAGRFQIADVPDGRYRIGFVHSLLDTLGIEPPLREIEVANRREVRVDLATPSAAQLRAAVCGADPQGVAMGIVRGAETRAAIAGASIDARWVELSLERGGTAREIKTANAKTNDNGWFVLCHLPRAGTITVRANHGADSTDHLDIDMPADGLLRRPLYLGTSDARVSGVVTAAVGERPLAGAQVTGGGATPARSNDRGEWMLADMSSGTRMLEVRAVGFYPDRRAVDVVDSTPPVRSSLKTMKTVLDTMRIVADARGLPRGTGFDERRRSGVGRYITAADVERKQPTVTSNLFDMVPGVVVNRDSRNLAATPILMRGVFEEWCRPAVYLNGAYLADLRAEDLDDAVSPREVTGIEIYMPGTTPVQFSNALGGTGRPNVRFDPISGRPVKDKETVNWCGSIVVWTKVPSSRHSWRGQLVRAAIGTAGIALIALPFWHKR